MTANIPKNIPTIESLIELCKGFDPKLASKKNDSSLCVTDLIEWLLVDGKPVQLRKVGKRWAGGYVRVSSGHQRTATNAERESRREQDRPIQDAQSEEEQLERIVRSFADKGQAFKIYSDAGSSGDRPGNKPELIERMLEARALRYEKIFNAVFLDPVSLKRWTPEEEAALRAYLKDHLAEMVSDISADETSDDFMGSPAEETGRRAPRRQSARARCRQGFSQLWTDCEKDNVHLILMTEESRLCRNADLYILFLKMLETHKVELQGLMSSVMALDITDPMECAFVYVMASSHAKRLLEINFATFRGQVNALKKGIPTGLLPWWLRRGKGKEALVIPDRAKLAEEIVEMSLRGDGPAAITYKLKKRGVEVGGRPLTLYQVHTVLDRPCVIGKQRRFGLDWPTLPRIISDEKYAALQDSREVRRAAMGENNPIHDESQWKTRLLTDVARCWCGRKTKYRTANVDGKTYYYYECTISVRDEAHALIRAETLEGFVEELLRHNPAILTGAYRNAQTETPEKRVEKRRQIEAQIAEMAPTLAEKERRAFGIALAEARATWPRAKDAWLIKTATGLAQGDMEEDLACLAAMRSEAERLKTDIVLDRQAVLLGQSLDALQIWDDLSVEKKNSLIKSIFDRLIIYPDQRGQCLELRLAGSEVSLPPVRTWRGEFHSLILPTVKQWWDGAQEEARREGAAAPAALPAP